MCKPLDYGAPLAVLVVTALSYWVKEPDGVTWQIPTRVACKQVYDSSVTGTWSTAGKLGDVPGAQIAVAIVPALIITVLFYFDHNGRGLHSSTSQLNLSRFCHKMHPKHPLIIPDTP